MRIGDEGPLGRILVAGEPGNEIVPELAPLPGEPVIAKPGKGAFYATGLHEVLRARGISHLAVCGVTTEVCVQTTLREANDRGYDCLLVKDGTESYFPQFKQATLEMVRAKGAIVGWPATAAEVLAALPQPGRRIGSLPVRQRPPRPLNRRGCPARCPAEGIPTALPDHGS